MKENKENDISAIKQSAVIKGFTMLQMTKKEMK